MRLSVQAITSRRLPLGNRPGLRLAQITGTKALDSAELFAPGRWTSLTAFRPNALAGSASDLHRLVERIDLGTIQLDSVDRYLFALTEVGDRPLQDVARATLWQRFGVPVYELYLDSQQRVVAYECEAHEGWHILPHARVAVAHGELVLQTDSGTLLRSGLARTIDSVACACGRPGGRIVSPEMSVADAADAPFANIA